MIKLFMAIAGGLAFLAVALGAFGAHALKNKISVDYLATYQTAVQYHMFHALGILAIAIVAEKYGPSSLFTASLWSILLGILIFSGSLYILSVTGIKILGAITPIGGVAFLVGWVLFIVAILKS